LEEGCCDGEETGTTFADLDTFTAAELLIRTTASQVAGTRSIFALPTLQDPGEPTLLLCFFHDTD